MNFISDNKTLDIWCFRYCNCTEFSKINIKFQGIFQGEKGRFSHFSSYLKINTTILTYSYRRHYNPYIPPLSLAMTQLTYIFFFLMNCLYNYSSCFFFPQEYKIRNYFPCHANITNYKHVFILADRQFWIDKL